MNTAGGEETPLVASGPLSLLPDPSAALPEPYCEPVTETFLSWVCRTPDRPAISWAGRVWTYAELDDRAQTLARILLTQALQPGEIVAVTGPRSFGLVAAMLAVFLSGGTLLTLDPKLPVDRQRRMLQEAAATRVLCVGPSECADEWRRTLPSLEVTRVDPNEGCTIPPEHRGMLRGIHLPRLSPHDPAYLFFTSGTSGVPKGVLGCHTGLSHFLQWQRETFSVGPEDRCSQLIGLSFDAVLRDVFLPLTSGARLHLPEEFSPADPGRVLAWLEREKISLLHTVPALAQNWLGEIPQGVALRAVRWVFFSGEPLTDGLVTRWRAAFPESGRIANLYGPTETSLAKCFYVVPPEAPQGTQPIGHPLPQTQALVMSPDGQLCGVGEPGEIVLRTPFRTLGYINAPEEQQKRFVKNPFRNDEQDLLYRTGDQGCYRPDGGLDIRGRLDDQVKIRGVRVEPGEVTSTLARHPGVSACVVVGRRDEQGQSSLAAYVVPSKTDPPTVSDLRAYLAQQLPAEMVPTALVMLDALPLTPNGKVDHRALPAPIPGRLEREAAPLAPRTPTEEVLAEIWAAVLGLEQVGVEESFFDLGGHSLLVTQVMVRVRDAFRLELPEHHLFEVHTVAGLAGRIEAAIRSGRQSAAPSLQRTSRQDALPLSFAQQRLWFLDQLQPGSAAYNIPLAVRLTGPLNVAALEQSLQEIVLRHEALRTTFLDRDGQPVQRIAPTLAVSLLQEDLQELPVTEQEAEVRRRAGEEARRPFDLAQGPLLRATLLHLRPAVHVLLLTLHHIVCDDWSVRVLFRELGALYGARAKDQPSPLAELPLQYADFAVWQRQWLQGEVLQTQLAYWKQQLAGAPARLELPTNRPRPAVHSFRGARQALILSPKLTEDLTLLSRREGVTLFMTLLAAFQALLFRYTGQEDVVVGSPIANRSRAEIEGLIGFFANTLALRSNLSGDPPFRELLGRVREVTIGAYEHQDVPFERLVEELRPERDPSHTPWFQVMLVLNNTPQPLELAGLVPHWQPVEAGAAKFDLTLSLTKTEQGLAGSLEYSTDLFEAAAIARMAGHFQTLLEGIVADPAQRISALPLLTEPERHQLLVEWNGIQADDPQDQCLSQLFEAQVQRTPDAVAVASEGGQLTYAQLNTKANQLARHLRALGVGPEVLVGICVERSLEMVVGLLGILKAGGAYLPLDPTYPKERLAFMLADAQVLVLVTQRRLVERLPEHGPHVVGLDTDWERITHESEENLVAGAKPDSLAYVIYTSGSTGQPKGVCVSHQHVVRLFRATASWFHFDAGDVWTLFHSYAFDFSVWELWGALLHGGRSVVVPYWVSRSPDAFYDLLRSEQVTVLNQTPSAFRQLMEAEEAAGAANQLALRLVIFGGEALELQSLKPWFERHGDQHPQLVNMYGITETTVHVTYRPLRAAGAGLGTGSLIGRPLPDLQLYLLDPSMQPVPIGVPGELYLGGAGLARGYLSRPDLTAERFLPDPFGAEPGARLYRTGDVARYLSDGSLVFLGRRDEQVKLRGFRIELGEIEAMLEQHPAVRQTTVLCREDEPGEKRLVAYLTTQDGTGVHPGELRSFLSERLPVYMVPSAFVELETLPLTPNGKVDRRALPAPARVQPVTAGEFVAPRTPVEASLAAIWSEVLGLDLVGIHDDFFELGGHSLRATQVVARVRQVFPVDLPLRWLFETPTVAGLAISIIHTLAEQADPEEVARMLGEPGDLPADAARLRPDAEARSRKA